MVGGQTARAPAPRAQEPSGGERLRFLRALASPSDSSAPPPPQPIGRAPEPPANESDEAVAVAPSRNAVRVVMYTTSWCPVCKQAKEWMSRRQIAFEERDVEASRENARRMHAINPRGSVPTFDVEGQVLVGFSERDLVGTMERAAAKQSARPPW